MRLGSFIQVLPLVSPLLNPPSTLSLHLSPKLAPPVSSIVMHPETLYYNPLLITNLDQYSLIFHTDISIYSNIDKYLYIIRFSTQIYLYSNIDKYLYIIRFLCRKLYININIDLKIEYNYFKISDSDKI